MYELKTKINDKSVLEFIELSSNNRDEDIKIILDLMGKVSGEEPKMWGDSIIGYGKYQYKYASGHGSEFLKIGFSPRKQNLTVYLPMYIDPEDELFSKLGKYKNGKGCLYIKTIKDVDLDVLNQILQNAYNSLGN